MPRMNRTPGLYALNEPPAAPQTGERALYKAEDDYAEWRNAVELRYCAFDAAVDAEFRARIASLRNA